MNDSHSFRISISYSGRNRDFVKQVDQELLKHLDHSEVFYDQRYSALMARPNLDAWLRTLFRDQSDLVVCFLSQGHQDSPWCQVEHNAVLECFQNNPDVSPPLLFTDGEFELGMAFARNHAQSIENLSPKEVADMIIERFDHHYPNARLRKSGKKTYLTAIFTTLIFLLIAGGMKWRDLSSLIKVDFSSFDESYLGVISLSVLVVPLGYGTYWVMSFLRPSIRLPKYIDPPTTTNHVANSDWEKYARELEEYTVAERKSLTGRLNDVRERRHILMASIFLSVLLVIGHFVICLVFEKNKGADETVFLPHIAVQSGESEAAGKWSFEKVFNENRGHRVLGAYYLIVVFLCSFVVNRKTQRPFATAVFMGAWQPLYLGIIYVLFILTQNYSALFGAGETDQGFFDEPGNFYVMERIVIVPALCWLAAILAGGLGAIGRKKDEMNFVE